MHDGPERTQAADATPGAGNGAGAPELASRRQRMRVRAGALGVLLAWLSWNFYFAAAERVTVHHPPNWPEFWIGTGLLAASVPPMLLAFCGTASARVLARIAFALAVLAIVWGLDSARDL